MHVGIGRADKHFETYSLQGYTDIITSGKRNKFQQQS